jgi:hypothetical protein
MNETPVLDDFEQAVVHTLQVKADQVVVDDGSFSPDAPEPLRLRQQSPGAVARPGRARLALAVAAAIAVLVGAAVVLRTSSTDDADLATGSPGFPGPAADDTTAALMPDMAPEGWTLADITHFRSSPEPTTWQLFAVDGPSPLPRAVLVMSYVSVTMEQLGESPTIDDPTHRVRGRPARLGAPTEQPGLPDDALELDWVNGDVEHNAVAIGLTEEELLDFVESLQPRPDAVAGFDAPADAALPQLDEVTNVGSDARTVHTGVVYQSPDGEGVLEIVTRSEPTLGGGLLYRMVGEPHGDGYLYHGGSGGTGRSFRGVRPDGWEVEVRTDGVDPGSRWLEGVVDSLRPTTYQDLVELALTHPLTTTATVGDRTVEVHATATSVEALCVTSGAGDRACSLVDDQVSSPVSTGSLMLGGEWIVVALCDGAVPTTFETAPNVPGLVDPSFVPQTLQPERAQSDGQLVELVIMPDDADVAAVGIPGNPYAGLAYRPSASQSGG